MILAPGGEGRKITYLSDLGTDSQVQDRWSVQGGAVLNKEANKPKVIRKERHCGLLVSFGFFFLWWGLKLYETS